jgi:hypothetical protein
MLAAAACGEAEEVIPTDQPGTVTDTPFASPTEKATPSPATATPAAGRAPDGCIPGEEKAYEDPDGRFAFCYPASAAVDEASTSNGVAVNLRYVDGETDVGFIFGLDADPYSPCGVVRNDFLLTKEERLEITAVGLQSVNACYRDVYDLSGEQLVYKAIDFSYQTESGSQVIVYAAYSEPSGSTKGFDVVQRVLTSIVGP